MSSTGMNPLPPQAFTKDTLMQAYQWLQGQSPNVKELATSPDVLVSLYFKAKSQGLEFLEKPSIQNFKDELKSLAGKMGEFDGKVAKTVAHQQQVNPSAPTVTAKTSTNTENSSSESQLDQASRLMISEIKSTFNLSTDSEAMRLIISTGYHKLKNFIANGNS